MKKGPQSKLDGRQMPMLSRGGSYDGHCAPNANPSSVVRSMPVASTSHIPHSGPPGAASSSHLSRMEPHTHSEAHNSERDGIQHRPISALQGHHNLETSEAHRAPSADSTALALPQMPRIEFHNSFGHAQASTSKSHLASSPVLAEDRRDSIDSNLRSEQSSKRPSLGLVLPDPQMNDFESGLESRRTSSVYEEEILSEPDSPERSAEGEMKFSTEVDPGAHARPKLELANISLFSSEAAPVDSQASTTEAEAGSVNDATETPTQGPLTAEQRQQLDAFLQQNAPPLSDVAERGRQSTTASVRSTSRSRSRSPSPSYAASVYDDDDDYQRSDDDIIRDRDVDDYNNDDDTFLGSRSQRDRDGLQKDTWNNDDADLTNIADGAGMQGFNDSQDNWNDQNISLGQTAGNNTAAMIPEDDDTGPLPVQEPNDGGPNGDNQGEDDLQDPKLDPTQDDAIAPDGEAENDEKPDDEAEFDGQNDTGAEAEEGAEAAEAGSGNRADFEAADRGGEDSQFAAGEGQAGEPGEGGTDMEADMPSESEAEPLDELADPQSYERDDDEVEDTSSLTGNEDQRSDEPSSDRDQEADFPDDFDDSNSVTDDNPSAIKGSSDRKRQGSSSSESVDLPADMLREQILERPTVDTDDASSAFSDVSSISTIDQFSDNEAEGSADEEDRGVVEDEINDSDSVSSESSIESTTSPAVDRSSQSVGTIKPFRSAESSLSRIGRKPSQKQKDLSPVPGSRSQSKDSESTSSKQSPSLSEDSLSELTPSHIDELIKLTQSHSEESNQALDSDNVSERETSPIVKK